MLKTFQFKRRNDGFGRLHLLVWFTFVPSLVLGIFRVLYGFRLGGLHHLPSTGAFIVVCNHQSHFDPMVVGSVLRDRAPRALARSSLIKGNGLAGWLIGTAFGSIPVDQAGDDPGGLRRMFAELKAGRGVIIYPEGQRFADGSVHAFQRGLWLLIKRGGVPIIPVGLDGMGAAWPPGRSKPHLRGRTGVQIGAPIPVEDLKALGEVEALAMLHQRVEDLVKAAAWWT